MTRQITLERENPQTLSLDVEEILENYRFCLEAANRSPKTIEWYLEILRRFFGFLGDESLFKPLDQLGPSELRAYIRHLQQATRWEHHPQVKKAGGRLSPYSVQGHVRAVKAFWSFLAREGHIPSNPLAKFPLPRVPDKPTSILSMEQIQKLLGTIDRSTPLGAKHSAMLQTVTDTGQRLSEFANILLRDLDLRHGQVRITGKGGKVRFVPLSAPCRRELARFIRKFRPQITQVDSPYLFPRADGRPTSANSFQQFLRRLAVRAGLQGVRCSPHVFRHTFATQSIANGANVFVLKEIMGHSSLQTTMKYVHLQPDDIRSQHAKFSPLVRMCRKAGTRRKARPGIPMS